MPCIMCSTFASLPYVNDFRAGQHKVDQSHIRPVVRHLVGEDRAIRPPVFGRGPKIIVAQRSEEHTSELQSLMRISYAVFCLKKKNKHQTKHTNIYTQNQKIRYNTKIDQTDTINNTNMYHTYLKI